MTSGRVLIGVILGGELKNDKKKIWGPQGPLMGLDKAKNPQISLKMSYNRFYLVITTKI
jgi:hypothetical protein